MKRILVEHVPYDWNQNLRDGAKARFAGKDWKENPYKDGTQASDEWDAGWYAANQGIITSEMEPRDGFIVGKLPK